MQLLKDLLPYINRENLINEIGEAKLLCKLFSLVELNGVSSDQEARLILYGSIPASNSSFKKLKQRLRKKFIENALSGKISLKNMDNYAAQYCRLLEQVLIVKKFNLNNARHIGTPLAEHIIRNTVLYEYSDLTLMLGRDLHYYYTSLNYQKAKVSKYENLLINTSILYQRESEATRYYNLLRHFFTTSSELVKNKGLKLAIEYSRIVSPWIKLSNASFQLLLMCYMIQLMRHEIELNIKEILNTCEEAIHVFKNRRVKRSVAFFLFDERRILCHIYLKNYKEVERIANPYLLSGTTSHINWFSLKGYVIISRLHNKDYQGANSGLNDIYNHPSFNKMTPNIVQVYHVYSAYLYFLAKINKIKTTNALPKFRIFKFLNDIPLFTKDKRGLNIAILIVHVLILLEQRNHGSIIDRIDALSQYCHRHLRRDETFRANCFIKMLIQSARAQFNRIRTERYTLRLRQNLESMPLSVSVRNIEVEIIPYEDLWEMVLDLLD